MSQEIQVKEVNFNGDQLVAATKNNIIYVAIPYVCHGIGLTEKQKDRQAENIKKDAVFNGGVEKLPLKLGGQVREVLCIALDFLPLWLAKISITPAIKKNNPQLAEKLITYQLKAKDVLASAFLSSVVPQMSPYELLFKNINENQKVLAIEQSKLSEKIEQHIEDYYQHKEMLNDTNLRVGYELDDLRKQIDSEIKERTSYIPVRPIVAKKRNVLQKVRENMLQTWCNPKRPDTAANYTERINNIIDNMIKNKWTVTDFKKQYDRKESCYQGDDVFTHDIGCMAYKLYTGMKL